MEAPPERAAVVRPSRRGILRRNPDFARLYAAQLISFAGDWFLTVALLGLVLETTGRPALAGLILAAQTLPYALASPFAGVVADRVDRRKLMIATDLARALVALAVLAARSEETIWIAFVATGLLSALGPFFEPAASAALPNLVPPADLAQANVLMSSAWGTMLAVGAALGGAVAAAFGRDAAIVADAASFAVSAALIATIHGRFREAPRPAHHVTILEDVRETVRYARRDRRVLALIAVKGGFGIGAGVIALLGVFAVQVFDQGDAVIGALMSARGAGAFLGPFLFRRFTRGGTERRLFAGISLAFALFGVCYALFAGAPSIWLAALAVLGAHMGGGGQWVLSSYALQRLVPDAIRGRVFAFDYGFVTLSISASLALVGFAAGRTSPRAVALGAAAVALVWAGAWTAWTRRLLE